MKSSNATPTSLPPVRPLRALKALRRLIADPADTQQVFTVIESLAGDAPLRQRARFEASEAGRRMLLERPDILPLLADRARLAALPEGSVGRAYLAFLEREGISADGLVAASAAGFAGDWNEGVDDTAFISNRLRDTHDLWHVLTGYQGDVLGEAALLGFTAAQTFNRGVALMAAAAVVRMQRPDVARLVWSAYRDGKRAAWLPTFDFEGALARPLGEVRRELNITAAAAYARVEAGWAAAA